MSTFIIVYFGGDQPASPEEGKQHQQKYITWLGSLGERAISPANPIKDTRTINPAGQVTHENSSTMSGYTIIEADSIERAVSVGKSCPFLEIGGSLEVSELINMSGKP